MTLAVTLSMEMPLNRPRGSASITGSVSVPVLMVASFTPLASAVG